MKLKRKALIIILIISLIVFCIALTSISIIQSNKPSVIAFYNLTETEVNTIKEELAVLIQTYSTNNKKIYKYSFLTLDDTLPLQIQLNSNKNIVLCFSWYGNEKTEIKSSIKPSVESLNQLPSTLRTATLNSLPILLDHSEIAYRVQLLSQNNFLPFLTMEEFVNFAEANRTETTFPLLIAGADNKTIGYFLSSLVEMKLGSSAAKNLAYYISENENKINNSNFLEEMLIYPLDNSSNSLNTIITELNTFKNQGLLNSQWTSFSFEELQLAMEGELASIVFMPLSSHRNIKNKAINNYLESYYPSDKSNKSIDMRSPLLTSNPIQ